jgi:hypothetical protein
LRHFSTAGEPAASTSEYDEALTGSAIDAIFGFRESVS